MSNFSIINESAMPDYIKAYGDLFPVEEAYFGKTKNLQEVENVFNEIWMECFGKLEVPSEYDIIAMSKGLAKFAELTMPTSSYMKRITAGFKKEFGFGFFSLSFNNFIYGLDLLEDTLDPMKRGKDIFNYPKRVLALLNTSNYNAMLPNGYTISGGVIKRMVTGNSMNRLSPIKTGSNEKYYDKHHLYSCHVHVISALIATRGFTPGMLMAVILHEIGHNFVCTPIVNLSQYFPIIHWMVTVFRLSGDPKSQYAVIKRFIIENLSVHMLSITESIFAEIVSEIYGMLMKFGPLSQLAVAIQLMLKTYDKTVEYIQRVMTDLGAIKNLALLTNPVFVLNCAFSTLPAYSNEVFADTFATAYGYGPDTVKVQAMFEGFRHGSSSYNNWLVSDKNPFSLIWRVAAISIAVSRQITEIRDPHPATQSRMVEQILKLEADVKSSKLSPELKKSALHDLAEAKEAYNSWLEADKNDRLIPVLTWWRTFNNDVMQGRDLRSFINELANLGMHRA